MDKLTVLLIAMIIIYLLNIICVCNEYMCNDSVSSILEKCYGQIFILMILMGIIVIIYESFLISNKKTLLSFIIMIILLIGIYGLIIIDNRFLLHYIFATIVFISIILYMICNCYIYKCTKLNVLLIIQIIISIILFILLLSNKDILLSEILLLIIFAIYYFIVHCKNM